MRVAAFVTGGSDDDHHRAYWRGPIMAQPARANANLTAMAKKVVPPTQREPQPGDEGYVVPLDDDAENWMAQHRLEQLRSKGWQGTVAEYIEEWERIGSDPLEQTPPITRG